MTTPNTTEAKQTPAVLQKDITEIVNSKLSELQQEGLVLPPNYSPANALKSAFFTMTNSANGNLLEACTKESISNALLDMAIQGISPAKTQCYFIPYGKQLKMTRSYFGTQAVMKRLSNVENIWANVIYEGDKFVYTNKEGRDYLVEHESCLKNRDNQIIGAYAIVKEKDGDMPMTVMSRKEIETSWSQGKTDKVQKKFPQEMAKRTVINRAAKNYVNTSDDSDILVQAIINTTDNEYQDDRIDKQGAMDVEFVINENANKKVFHSNEIEAKEEKEPAKAVKTETHIVDHPTGSINDNDDGQPNWTL